MAEFQDVMRQAKRMCKEHDECDDCALREMADKADIYCPIQTMRKLDAAKVEAAVMDWAAKHPEPRYPSWNEAWKQLMPNAHNKKSPCPCFFLDTDRAMKLCNEQECIACKNTTIPADIAEKLGIKPIGGDSDENA